MQVSPFPPECLEISQGDARKPDRLHQLQDEVAREKGLSPDTLRRLLAKVEQYSECHRANGLPDELLAILNEDLGHHPN